jgi:hypothetical protein
VQLFFNISVISVYLASKFDNEVFLQTFDAIVVLLSILFTISLIADIKKKAEKKIIISFVIFLRVVSLAQ